MITQERLKELLHYDPETGCFTWKHRDGLVGKQKTWNIRWAGKPAGNLNKVLGYVMVYADGKNYLCHRLAWLYVHGEIPGDEIDHIDGNRANNVLSNLRPATRKQNAANSKMRVDNKTGLKGVFYHRNRSHQNKPWQSRIKVNCRNVSLGYFNTKEAAYEAYVSAAEALRGEFARAA